MKGGKRFSALPSLLPYVRNAAVHPQKLQCQARKAPPLRIGVRVTLSGDPFSHSGAQSWVLRKRYPWKAAMAVIPMAKPWAVASLE